MAARPALLSLELSGDSKSYGRKQQPARVPPCGRMQEVVSGCVQIQMLMSQARMVGRTIGMATEEPSRRDLTGPG